MDKFSFISLWDAYSGLLTKTQQEITHLYFNLDLTVSEIAEQKGISRQAVSECLKGCKKQLEEYEDGLHVLERLHGARVAFAAVRDWAESFQSAHPEFTEDITALKQALDKNYSKKKKKAKR